MDLKKRNIQRLETHSPSLHQMIPRRLQLPCQAFIQGVECFTKGSMDGLHGSDQGSVSDFAARFIKNQSQQQLPIDSLGGISLSRGTFIVASAFKGCAHKQENAIGLSSEIPLAVNSIVFQSLAEEKTSPLSAHPNLAASCAKAFEPFENKGQVQQPLALYPGVLMEAGSKFFGNQKTYVECQTRE